MIGGAIMSYKPIPIGVDDFEDIIENGYYYVDKTMFIKNLLDKKGKVNLFTRPRRFALAFLHGVPRRAQVPPTSVLRLSHQKVQDPWG